MARAHRQLDFEIPVPSWEILANDTGSLTRSADWQTANFTWLPLGGVLQSGDQFEVTVQRALDAPPDTFNLFRDVRLPPGRYWWTRTGVRLATSAGRPLSGSVTASSGDFYDGRNQEFDLGATWRGRGRLILGAGFTQSAVRLPEGAFDARVASARIEYAFGTRSDVLVFAQHTNDDDRVDFNLRFHWARVIGDDLYLVWNSGYTTDPAARFRFPSRDALERPLNGAVILKIVHRIGR